MKFLVLSLALASTLAASGISVAASESQAPQTGPSASAPAFVRLDGEFMTATREARTGSVVVVVSLYAGQDDTAPLWSETQAATLDAAGRYTIFAGATQAEGMPREFFTSNTAQWIGVAVQGEAEQPRVRMVSVPYALSAGNADTLAGRTTDDFVLAEKLTDSVKSALKAEGVAAAGAGTDPGILGTAGIIPKFTGVGDAVIDSIISESGGNIGIGVAAPSEVFHLNAAPGARPFVRFTEGFAFRGGFGVENGANYLTGTADNEMVFLSLTNLSFGTGGGGAAKLFIKTDGNVGIGTSAPSEFLHLNSAAGARPFVRFTEGGVFRGGFGVENGANYLSSSVDNEMVFLASSNLAFGTNAGGAAKLFIKTDGNIGVGTVTPTELIQLNSGAGGKTLMRFSEGGIFRGAFGIDNGASYLSGTVDNDMILVGGTNLALGTAGGGAAKVYINSAGNVGIGMTAPTSKLHVAGCPAFPAECVRVDGNIAAKYQDVAEWVETPSPLEAGTVVIVDPVESNRVIMSPRAYDTRVAGAVSRQPGLILGEAGDGKSMVAQSGRVIIKVDATFGAIKPGDLLVTSPTPGHAMLSKPLKIGGQLLHRPGTLVGKALEALPSGKGEILVLLTLQ